MNLYEIEGKNSYRAIIRPLLLITIAKNKLN